MGLYFDKYAQEGNRFLNELANELGHPEEKERTAIILRSVLHIIRDRLTMAESLNLLSQLPMFLKAVYVENWKYRERPEKIRTIDDFKEKVKEEQARYGESEFNWEIHTEDIVKKVFKVMSTYLSEGEIQNIYAQLPEDLHPILEETR